ncbi:TPA: hypothetical protein ACH3X1_006489 [Trebouxia sp. C0004]
MGKNDFLTPKAISNRIKSKGLQKLRFFCQMCQKQCRDENGFKCHLNSESHKRQMEIFGQNADRVIAGYSEEFEADFMELMRRSHPRARVAAKNVYNEFIADKYHVHMNSTKWYTLTEFVKYLGKTGKCRVDETPKGWFISLIQADPLEEIGKDRKAKRDRAERDEEQRRKADIEAQIERAQKYARVDEGLADMPQGGELQRDEADGQPLKIALTTAAPDRAYGKPPIAPSSAQLLAVMSGPCHNQTASIPANTGRKDEPWLAEGIVVKVMSKALKDSGYYKGKGVINKVLKRFVAEISMLDGGGILQVDQAELETVLPQPGGTVCVLQGPYRGCQASMVGIDEEQFKANVRLINCKQAGKVLSTDYEDVSKTASCS